MKKLFIIIFIITICFNGFAQFANTNAGNLSGGLGLTWIDDQPYYNFRFTPEISFANFGAGLDLNLQFNSKGLRKENFNETSDYLSVIRYLRYGQKKDPVFVKIGAIDYYTLGHGSMIYLYNNSPSFDSRKIGLAVDVDLGKYGVESIYSDFSQAGVLGIRGYARPLQFTSVGNLPVIGNMEIGFSFAGDYNDNAGILSAYRNPTTNALNIYSKEKSVSMIGFDIGIPLVNSSMFSLDFYTDYVKINNYGSGAASGLIANLSGLGMIKASAKLERRWNDKEFIPAYFNSLYEIERFKIDPASNTAITKVLRLKTVTEVENGFYGELGINVMSLFDVVGSFQKLDKDPNSGILHLFADVSPKDGSFVARAGYDKIYIKDGEDLFTLDDRSYLFVEAGYKPYPYMIVSLIYNWTFTPRRDKDDKIIGYEPQKKIEPRVSFIYPFDLGGKK
jgi:hypothetical protein